MRVELTTDHFVGCPCDERDTLGGDKTEILIDDGGSLREGRSEETQCGSVVECV